MYYYLYKRAFPGQPAQSAGKTYLLEIVFAGLDTRFLVIGGNQGQFVQMWHLISGHEAAAEKAEATIQQKYLFVLA
jgi:hypothetical protein